MKRQETLLPGVLLLELAKHADSRGFFTESYSERTFTELGIRTKFVQDNHSLSQKGVVRGLHFQSAPGQVKLVRCTRGEILDIVADINPHSLTYRKWIAVKLSPKLSNMLYIPGCYAHGFAVLKGPAEVQYKCSTFYNASIEKTIKYDDLELNINWRVKNPIVSDRDSNAPSLQQYLDSLPKIWR